LILAASEAKSMSEHLIELAREADTLALGASLARDARGGLVLYLSGDLGTGKTTLARGLIRALGYPGAIRSPTYALVEVYELSSIHLYHFDFYRFKNQREWEDAGFRDYFGPHALAIVEWPERAGDLLAPADLEIRLEFAGTGRLARVRSASERGERWLARSRLRSAPSS
jgi:tRNA threonylcarbamoyladenosine biosynthesis protein TsaE